MKKICLMFITFFLILINGSSYCAIFLDIENHWAKNEIEEFYINDIISGYDNN